MVFCSAGYNRICIYSNGNIIRCYSKDKIITNINDFNAKKHIKLEQCDNINCGICDNGNTIKNNSPEFVVNEIKKRKIALNFQVSITDACYNFCPYCNHSDNMIKYRSSISPVSIEKWNSFFNKISYLNSLVILCGGEPTIREDLYKITESNQKVFLMMSSLTYPENIKKIIESFDNAKKELYLIPTFHYYGKLFNWDIFWENIKCILKSKNVKIVKIRIVNYKTEEYIKKVREKCSEYKIKIEINNLDVSMLSERMDKKLQFNKIINSKKFINI